MLKTATPDELAELLGRVGLGDREAFAQLYQRTSAHLYGLALRILKDESLAQEAVQDAYIQVWKNAASYRASRGAVMTWLGTLSRYRALDLLRSRRPTESLDDVPEPMQADPSPSWLAATDLERCWGVLSADQQQALSLAYIEGCSHSELATRLETPLGTVKSWVRRGLAALKQCLSREPADVE